LLQELWTYETITKQSQHNADARTTKLLQPVIDAPQILENTAPETEFFHKAKHKRKENQYQLKNTIDRERVEEGNEERSEAAVKKNGKSLLFEDLKNFVSPIDEDWKKKLRYEKEKNCSVFWTYEEWGKFM